MPLYTLTTQAGSLNDAAKGALASKLTDLHCALSGVARDWVHVVFHDYPVGSGFTAGRPAATVGLTVLIRTGRLPEYKRRMLLALWEVVQDATGAPDEQIVIGIQEVPPSQAMEMGKVMPDVTP